MSTTPHSLNRRFLLHVSIRRARNFMLWLIAAGLSWAAALVVFIPQNAHAQSLSSPSAGLRISQTVVGVDSATSSVQSQLVGINFGASATHSPQASGDLSANYNISTPFANYGNGTHTRSDVLHTAKILMNATSGAEIAQKLKRVLPDLKASSAVFVFNQEIKLAHIDRMHRLTWSVTVTDDGRVFIPDPQLIDPEPTTLYITYTSSAVDSMLPASWQHADAGVLTWQVFKLDGTEVTPVSRINTGGAFNEAAADPDLMVNCIAQRSYHASCPLSPGGFLDALTLMNRHGSTSVLIDYVRKVSPAYNAAGNPEDPDYKPAANVSFDERLYTRNTCAGGVYRNRGRIGYELETVMDRFQWTTDLPAAQPLNRYTKRDISPTATFDVSQPTTGASAVLNTKVVNPWEPNTGIIDVSEMASVVHLAPVRVQNNFNASNNITVVSRPADMAANVVGSSDGLATLTLNGPTSGIWVGSFRLFDLDNIGWGGSFVTEPYSYDRSFTINITSAEIYDSILLTRTRFQDWLMVSINGHTAFVGPHGSYSLSAVNLTPPLVNWFFGGFSHPIDGYVLYDGIRACFGCQLTPSQPVTDRAHQINIKPWLRTGNNTISVRVISGSYWYTAHAHIEFTAIPCQE